jgi:hypothetical protein
MADFLKKLKNKVKFDTDIHVLDPIIIGDREIYPIYELSELIKGNFCWLYFVPTALLIIDEESSYIISFKDKDPSDDDFF